MNELFDSDLFNYALIKPSQVVASPDSLCIVSGYASHALASGHILNLKALHKGIKINVVYGMAGVDGVNKIDHQGFVSLHNKVEYPYDGSFDCHYVKKPKSVHAKVYVWCKGGAPVRAFSGSANYTNNGFKSNNRIEALSECDPITAFAFFKKQLKGTVPCHKALKEEFVTTRKPGLVVIKKGDPVVHVEMNEDSPYHGCPYIDIPLRNKKGLFGVKSGLNWGLDKSGKPRLQNKNKPNGGRRDPDEAYIRVPKAFDCGFFPPYVKAPRGKGAAEAQIRFSVLTDDNEMFSCVRTSGGYGKEIDTPQDNAELGRWFRKRLGLSSGAMITPAVMKAYGRESVRFYKLDDEKYAMDFSRPKE